ncbi:MAG TPA: extracellular solute-binding protein [Anaerolineae bacterium]|nr:extracellular solute-binding protein [Anaerolineae bacterium]
MVKWSLSGVLLIVVAFCAWRVAYTTNQGPVRLIVYAFSTQEEVLTQDIFPAFEQEWETRTGRDLSIEGVFGPSATLAGQINLGAPADVALLSNEQHVNWLKIGRRVRQETQPVVVCISPMVIVTRLDNPYWIEDFGDLGQPGLQLLHADPRSSGAGAWGILAEYGSVWLETGNVSTALSQLSAIWSNVKVLGPTARATLTLFELGAGDAFVTYEQDAYLALDRNIALTVVIPTHTIVAHHMAVIVDDNVTLSERTAAKDFINFLLSDTGQQAFIRYHQRPAMFVTNDFPQLVEPFTVEDLGGWSKAYIELVENLWQAEIEPRLNLEPAVQLLDAGEE